MTDDFSLNDMINFFSASGSGVKVVVIDEEDVVEIKKVKKDDRYITERIVNEKGDLLMVRVTMKEYKEWVDENGEPQVFHKTDTVGFKSPLIKKGNK